MPARVRPKCSPARRVAKVPNPLLSTKGSMKTVPTAQRKNRIWKLSKLAPSAFTIELMVIRINPAKEIQMAPRTLPGSSEKRRANR